MADIQLSPRSAFAGLLPQTAAENDARVTFAPRPDMRLATVIARRGARSALAERALQSCGLVLPDGPRRATTGRTTALGIGPRSWLVLEDGGTPDFASGLAAGLSPLAAVSEQSDGYAVLRIAGPAARAVLAKGLAVDLHPCAFDPSRVAVSSCAHIGVTLWQVDEVPTFELALFRSYAGSFAHWLTESAAEFGYGVSPGDSHRAA